MDKKKIFHVDEWVWYIQFYDSQHEELRNIKQKAVVLYAYEDKNDKSLKYRIFVDETSKIINVRAAYLFPIEPSNY